MAGQLQAPPTAQPGLQGPAPKKPKLSAADRDRLLREEAYVLRVQDRGLAERVRLQLAQPDAQAAPDIDLDFSPQGGGRQGTLSCEGQEYPLVLQDLPTKVDLIKSKNDIDYVKGGEVGQILLVRRPGAALPNAQEYPHGVTPPLRNVKEQVFARTSGLEPARLRQLTEQLQQLCEARAPEGWEIQDVEEEYQVDAQGNGAWVAVPVPQPDAAAEGAGAVKASKKGIKSPGGRGRDRSPGAARGRKKSPGAKPAGRKRGSPAGGPGRGRGRGRKRRVGADEL